MCKSLLKELRFTIGEQYELNEFNLKTLKSTFSNGLEYENYEYIKDDIKTVFGVELSSNIILQYNGDILSGIIYKLDVKDLGSLIKKLNDYLPLGKKIDIEKIDLGKTITNYSFQEFSLSVYIGKDVRLRVFKLLGQT
tara:strand:+ start:240 stop:653 length:414 start_codon:yes stop_codon:yes gene_type:complete